MAPISGILVTVFGLYLLGLAILIFVNRKFAERFLRLFASSARAHYSEQLLRLLVGFALVVFSPFMWLSAAFHIFGWVIVVTAVGLLFVPWRWHHRFAEWAIPLAIRHLQWLGLGALALGAFILYGTSRIAFDGRQVAPVEQHDHGALFPGSLSEAVGQVERS